MKEINEIIEINEINEISKINEINKTQNVVLIFLFSSMYIEVPRTIVFSSDCMLVA